MMNSLSLIFYLLLELVTKINLKKGTERKGTRRNTSRYSSTATL